MYFIEPKTNINPGITTSAECSMNQGNPVNIQGFVHRIRSLGGANFMVLRDGTGEIQVFVDAETPGFREVKEGFIVRISGLCKTEERAPKGFEVVANNIEIIVAPPEELPFTINKDNLKLHLDLDILCLNNCEINIPSILTRCGLFCQM